MRLELIIDGMVAVHARHAVFTALSAVEGVQRAEVELGRVVLELGPTARSAADALAAPGVPGAEAREQEIVAAVEAVGFTVREVRRLPRTLPTL